MKRVAIAVFFGAALAAGGAAAACPASQPGSQPKLHSARMHSPAGDCVDLAAVPRISADIAASAPMATPGAPQAPAYINATPTTYQGPTLGLAKPDPGVKAVPTIGYKWSLE